MPNHVPCVLTVSGCDLDDFVEFAKGPNPIFRESKYEREDRIRRNKIAGKPEDYMPPPRVDELQCDKFISVPQNVLDSGYGEKDSLGYDWCVRNWGTKWGCYDCSLAQVSGDGHEYAVYTFKCAWSPCLPVIDEASKRFPALTFHLRWFNPSDDSHHGKTWAATTERYYDEEAGDYRYRDVATKEALDAS